jgi:DNA polymerase-3 subunit alpha
MARPRRGASISALVEASRRTGAPVVATNDVHYLNRNEAMAHEVLLGIGEDYELTCIGHRFLPGGPEYYLKTPAEMEELFGWYPEAIRNTVRKYLE